MNDELLRIHLDDHLALMVGEIELIGRSRGSNHDNGLGEFLGRLEDDVSEQKAIVEKLIHLVGGGKSVTSSVKQGAAWFAEKLGRLKLNDSLLAYSDLSRVIELEALSAAAHARILLWDNLDFVAGDHARLAGIAFSILRDQSQQHLEELNTHRRAAATRAFLQDETRA